MTHSNNNHNGQTFSLWMEEQLPSFAELEEDLQADICIVGAGITGLSCAYTLAKQGKSVVVLEQNSIAGGQTSRTSAHLTWTLDDRFFNLEKYFGEEGAKLAAQSHNAAIDYVEKIVKEEKIDCEFERVDGYLFRAPEDSLEILEKEFKAIKKTGMQVNQLPKAPFTTFDTGPCLHFPHQAQFHILKYIQGLIKALLKYGVKIYTNTHVQSFKDGLPCLTQTDTGYSVHSKDIIVATCTPVNNRFFIHTKQAAYRTYVIAASIPKDSVPKGLYWDTPDPYHYIRTKKNTKNTDWLIVGGEDHKTGQDSAFEEKYEHLEKWAKERFPMMGDISYRWSGQIYEPIDSLAFIGRNKGDSHIYIATGDSGNGLTHGTIAALLLPDLILKKDNPWKNLYDPTRKTLLAMSEFLQENVNALVQLKDWLTPGEIQEIEALPADKGFILRKGLKKLAVYKDLDGKIHINSAFCPHLGGCLRWNEGEKTWDCPLHGSRFEGSGKVLDGPAISCLHCEKNSKTH